MSAITRIFENENWLAVDKPSGWLTTPAREKADHRSVLGRTLQDEVGAQIYPVHRLDFEVSGLVLFARTKAAHTVGQKWFESGAIQKTYRARTVPGVEAAPFDWVEWRSRLARGKRRAFLAAHGKESVTRARVIEAGPHAWIWELEPITGRPHQLRVELANHGAAILGDELYGGPKGSVTNRIELTAIRLDVSQVSAADRLGLPERIELD